MTMPLDSGAAPIQFPTAARPLKRMPPRPASWTLAAYFLLASLAFFPMHASAQKYRSGEYDLKAAMLFNLVKFIEWPATAYPSAQAPTVLCTLGRDPFGSALNEYAGNSVNGRSLVIRRLLRYEDAHGCHLVYISSSERKLLAQLLKNLQSGPILTVGEMEQFAVHGGMIQLTIEEKQVHFTINLSAASREELRIRSNLLALSRIVESSVNPGTKTGLLP
jgi:YfiR/HmsC-like